MTQKKKLPRKRNVDELSDAPRPEEGDGSPPPGNPLPGNLLMEQVRQFRSAAEEAYRECAAGGDAEEELRRRRNASGE